jgi:ATP-dependent Lon protease
MNSINLEEFREIFDYLVDNNKRLQDEGKKTSSVGLEGPAGIGKTAIVEQIARERGMTFIKLNLSQLEEIGDLIGFPLKQFKIILHSESGDKEV